MKTDRDKIRLTTLSHGSGWACKIGSDDLAQVLGNLNLKQDNRVLIGFQEADDAAVVRLDGDRYLVLTVDFFTPIVDDPYQFGQIAAADNISPSIVAEGIGQALNTTAFGLVVAVILQFGQNIVMFIIDNIVVTIQKSTTIVLQSIAKKNN